MLVAELRSLLGLRGVIDLLSISVLHRGSITNKQRSQYFCHQQNLTLCELKILPKRSAFSDDGSYNVIQFLWGPAFKPAVPGSWAQHTGWSRYYVLISRTEQWASNPKNQSWSLVVAVRCRESHRTALCPVRSVILENGLDHSNQSASQRCLRRNWGNERKMPWKTIATVAMNMCLLLVIFQSLP